MLMFPTQFETPDAHVWWDSQGKLGRLASATQIKADDVLPTSGQGVTAPVCIPASRHTQVLVQTECVVRAGHK